MAECVSLCTCTTYDFPAVRQAVVALLEPLGDIAAFVAPGETVLIKPNMLSAKAPEAAVTTHPAVVRAVAELVIGAGGTAIIGDSPGIGGFTRVAEKTGIGAAAAEAGATLVPFNERVEVQGSGTFRRIAVARPYWEADKIINLPKLKTHEMMTLTCCVKNLFGAVVGAEKAGWHLKAGTSREVFARLLLEIYLLKKPCLNIVDGIVAMEGDGPGSGDPVALGVLLAGANAVAVDVVAGKMAGIAAEALPVQQMAAAMGLAGSTPEEVAIVGGDPAAVPARRFRLPKGLDVQFGMPGFLKRGLRNHLTSMPAVNAEICVLCGICRDACPARVIEIKNSALSIDTGRCIRCWCCRELCPHDAMGLRQSLLLKIIYAVRGC